MKTIKTENLTYSMLEELSKRHQMKIDRVLFEIVEKMYVQMKRTGRKVL